MNTSEESGEWTNPDGQNDRSMDDEEEEETEEEHETSSEIEEEYSVEEEEDEGEDEMEDEVEDSRSESSPHMHINGHGNNDENDHHEEDEDEDEEDDDDSEEEGADIGVKEDYQNKQVQQNPIPQNGIHGGNPKMTSSPREHHFVVTRQRDAVPMQQQPVKQNGNMVARQDDGDEEEEEIEPGIIGPLHIDHVDFILDSIDAELSDLITKSDRGSPEERKKKNLTKKKTSSIKVSGGIEGAHQNGPQSANTTMDTSLSQDHQVQPNGRYGMLPVRKKTKKTGKGRMKTRSQPSLTSPPKLRINNFSMDDSVGTNSDADSITAEEVRRRVVQSLHQQEKSRSSSLPPHNQLTCSQEYHLATTPATNHNSNINSSSLQSPPTTADNSPNAKTAEVNNNEVETRKRMTGETKKGRTKPVGKTQEGRKKRSSVSSNSSKNSNRKVPISEHASSTQQQGSPVSDVSGAFGSRGDGSNHIVRLRDILNHYGDVGEESEKASLATDYLVSQAAGVRNISDLESVATEDFESAFQKFSMPDSARSHRSKRQGKANLKQGKNSKPVNESAAQQLQRVKNSAEEKKMKRTVSAPPVEPSGLPEYMYMHKEVSENDVGGDSMITEDYEAHFLAIPLKNIQTEHPGVTPKKSPSRSRRKGSSRARQTQPQSDPESVQTEDYEKRFHSMMVRRLAGVPLCSFDSVTIQSDLDSVKSLDIKKKFRKAMHKHEISGTSSIEEEDIQRSKVTPRSQRSKGSRSSSLQCQSSELLKMKATMQQTKKGNPQVMHPHHPTMHLTSPALHHSSMPNLSTAVLPGHSHPSVQPQTYAPPPPRDKWRSPPRVSHLESQPSPLRKSAKPSSTQGAQHREGNIHQSEGHEPRLQSSSHEHPGLRSVGQPQMTSTPQPSHSGGGAGYMDPQRQAEQQARLQHMIQSENSLRTSLDGMQASLKELKNRKQDAVEELKTLHEAVKRNKSDIQQAEDMARMSVEKGDGLRSELMVLEYQRDQARRELKDLEEGIGTARRIPTDDGASGRLAQIGLSAEEILGVIRERDELQVALETERGSHISKEERDEVVSQLDQTRQELFESQKSSRAKVEKLQEDLEEGRGKIESLKLIESDLKKELSEAQEALKNSENDHHKQLLEKTTTMEEMQGKATTECADLRHKLSESTRRITTLESALLDKDVVTTRMQDRIRGQGQEVLELTNKVDELEKEREMRARKAETVKEVALVELRGKLLKEKDEELDQQKKTLEKTHQEVLTKQQTQATQRQTQLEKENEEKESELKELREKLAQQEISTRTLGDQMRQEAQEQIQKALEEQKAIFEMESEKERQREALAKEDAVAIETKQLNEELKREKQLRGTLKTSHSNMKEELEKLRDENLAAGREKVEAVSKAREEARQEIQTQLDQIRDQMAQEKTRETEKLQQKLKQQDEELTQLRSEVKGYRQKQRDSSSSQSSFDQSYRSIVMELNEECRKTSNLVGSTPRKVPLFSSRNMKADSPSQTGSSKQASFNSPGRTQLMAAISNLKATNDDLRNYIKSLRDDVEKQRRATTRANREKDNEVKKLVESMGREKAQVFEGERDMELDRLHRSVSLLQDSENSLQQDVMNKDEELRQIQSNMATWKEETALKMARKFEDELNKELEVRLEESHSGSGSFRSNHSDSRMRNSALAPSTPSSAGSGETGTNKLLRHLQDRVKQLRSENTSLKQASRLDNSLESGDSSFQKSLQLEEKDQHLYRLDQKVKLLERQLWVAEERCRENAALYSQKTAENTRLEGALTQQTKELMKVERAYTKLSHSTPTSPVP